MIKFNDSFNNRFWDKVNKTEGCWLWTGTTKGRYGRISINETGELINAHRASYILHFGDIEYGNVICHKCDNPKCVNPKHLFSGTQGDNIRDCHKKERDNTAHNAKKLTDDQVLWIRSSSDSNRKIAKSLGITHQNVSAIKTNKTWKHVQLKKE